MMTEHSREFSTESIRSQVERLIINFKTELHKGSLREKVLALIPIFDRLRELGKSLVPDHYAAAARDRILYYFREYAGVIIRGDELLVVSGIQDYPRRIRELRVQFGWAIASGVTIRQSLEDVDVEVATKFEKMKPSEYVLLTSVQDREAAHRWNVANSIRKEKLSVRDKILKFLRHNVGQRITNEELRYVANNKTEWARRVRELRTEEGWPVVTKATGLPFLDVGIYVLMKDRQSPPHDRHIPDYERRKALRRDGYTCQECKWTHSEWNPSDPRHLELHHLVHHEDKGPNLADNLRTLCTVCHDRLHATERHRC